MTTINIKQFLFALVITCLSTWASAVTYSYDALNRLTAVDYGNGAPLAYSYDAAGNLLSVTSTGSPVLTPALSLSTTSLSFGSQNISTISAAQSVALSNTGTGTLNIASIVASGDYALGSSTTCGSTLAAGANCTISVTFTPTATGTRSGSITINNNSTNNPAASVSLSGTGVAVNYGLSASPSSLTFTTQSISTTSAPQAITLSNTGIGTLSISSIAASGDYARSTTCGATLGAGTNCSISVTFTPTAAGTRTGTITITSNATGSPHSVSLSGTGIVATPVTPKTYSDNGDGTVTDPTTGLQWMRCSVGQTWTGSTCTGTASTYTWVQANALTGTVTFAGQSDWRVPNIRELQTIVDLSVYSPAIDTAAFPNTPMSDFWSASANASSSGNAGVVHFGNGLAYDSNKSSAYHVRLMRSGQSLGLLDIARPSTDYVDQGNGTVIHTPTGLMWQRCAVGQTWTGSTCSGTASTFTWDAARLLTSTFAGQTDWRLPTEDELVSLVDYSKVNPAINITLFPNTSSWSGFWSASAYAYGSGSAWYVEFYFGSGSYYSKSGTFQVRLVRAGQSFGFFALTVAKSGNGTVTSSPTGISCGATCSASYASGASVTLTATPDAGSTFTGWSGACSGTGACTVTMNQAQSVTAAFVNVNVTTPPTCTLTASPVVISAGSSSTLTASCTPAATSYTWTNSGFSSTASSGTVSPTTPTVYTVVASNAAGNSNAASTAVYVCNTPPSQVYAGQTLIGTGASEPFHSGIGNDTIDGAAGIDTVIYNCNRSRFTLTKTASGWSVSSAAEGIDTLSNIDRIQFPNETLALDISGNAGQAYRVYQAAFNRIPDNAGLKFWIGAMDNGASLNDVAAGFINSAEFQSLYGSNPSNPEFVTKLYSNVLHRAPDQAGYDYWVDVLNRHLISNIDTLVNFSESPENQAGVLGAILNGIDLLN